MSGQAVHEGVVQDVALELGRLEAVRAGPARPERLGPAGRVGLAELADVGHVLGGVGRIGRPGAEEACSSSLRLHRHVRPLAWRKDPVVPVRLGQGARAEGHPVAASAFFDLVVDAGLQVLHGDLVRQLALGAVGECRVLLGAS